MSDLFVFYQAHDRNGKARINNMVFKDCSAIETINDIFALEREIVKLYDYEDAKIQHWQRMETKFND